MQVVGHRNDVPALLGSEQFELLEEGRDDMGLDADSSFFAHRSEKTPRDGTGTETARGEAPWQGGGEGDHGGDAHAAFFLGTKMPGSAFSLPPVSCWIWSCLRGGGYSPHPAIVDCAIFSAVANLTCVP